MIIDLKKKESFFKYSEVIKYCRVWSNSRKPEWLYHRFDHKSICSIFTGKDTETYKYLNINEACIAKLLFLFCIDDISLKKEKGLVVYLFDF